MTNASATSGLVENERVYFASNDGQVVACQVADGQVVWRTRTLGRCLRPPRAYANGLLIWSEEGVELLDFEDGRSLWQIPRRFRSLFVAGPFLVTQDEKDRLRGFSGTRRLYSLRLGFCTLELSAVAGLVAERRVGGLSLLDPRTGERLHSFRPQRELGQADPPDTADGMLYVLNNNGRVRALHLPRSVISASTKTDD